MAQDADAVMIAANGSVHVAPSGTTLPDDVSTALATEYVDLGYINSDGATFNQERETNEITPWQSLRPIKRVTESVSEEVSFALLQWDADTIPFAFGGGTIEETDVDSGEFVYTPPDPEDIDERVLVVEWAYDDANFRLVVPKVMVEGSVETELTRSSASELPLTLAIIGTDGAAPYQIYSDHPAWEPAA